MNVPLYRQQPGQIMSEPPNVNSTKDHLYLKDALSWQLTAMKMLRHGADNCNDPESRKFLHRAGQMHQQHYQVLLSHLNPANVANH